MEPEQLKISQIRKVTKHVLLESDGLEITCDDVVIGYILPCRTDFIRENIKQQISLNRMQMGG